MESLTPFISEIISSYGYAGVFILMVINGALSFPSSQILYIVLGILASKGILSPTSIIFAGAIGNAIGNYIIYRLVYIYGPEVVKKFSITDEKHLHTLHDKVTKHGLWVLFLGKLTPSIKVIVPTVAGIAQISKTAAIFIFSVASFIWAMFFIYLGYYFGNVITFEKYSLVIGGIGIMIAVYFYFKFIKEK